MAAIWPWYLFVFLLNLGIPKNGIHDQFVECDPCHDEFCKVLQCLWENPQYSRIDACVSGINDCSDTVTSGDDPKDLSALRQYICLPQDEFLCLEVDRPAADNTSYCAENDHFLPGASEILTSLLGEWQLVFLAVAVEVLSIAAFIWQMMLHVKNRKYLATEKEKVRRLSDEKKCMDLELADLKEQSETVEMTLLFTQVVASFKQTKNRELQGQINELQKRHSSLAEELSGLKKTVDDQAKAQENQRRSAESNLERLTKLGQEREDALKQELARERIDRKEREAKMTCEIEDFRKTIRNLQEHTESAKCTYKARIKELEAMKEESDTLLLSAQSENRELKTMIHEMSKRNTDVAEELFDLHKSIESERESFEKHLKKTQEELEAITKLFQEKDTALQWSLAQNDEYQLEVDKIRNNYERRIQELLNAGKEKEASLTAQIKFHQKRAQENLMSACQSQRALEDEREEAAMLREQLAEVNAKLTKDKRDFTQSNSEPKQQVLCPGKDVTAPEMCASSSGTQLRKGRSPQQDEVALKQKMIQEKFLFHKRAKKPAQEQQNSQGSSQTQQKEPNGGETQPADRRATRRRPHRPYHQHCDQ